MLSPPRTPVLTGRHWSASFWLLVVMDEAKEHELIAIENLTI